MIITNMTNKIKEKFENEAKKLLKDHITAQKNEKPNGKYVKNGYQSKLIHTICGTLELALPRLRYYSFDYELLEAEIMETFIKNLCIELYGHGLSTRRIANSFQSIDIKISKSKVAQYCKALSTNVQTYFDKDLTTYDFAIIHIDGKYFRVKNVNSNRKAVLLNVVGITTNGQKIHFHMDVKPSEDKQYIQEFLRDLKIRIGDTNACFVIDGNNNLPATVNDIFPNAKVQRCLVHVSRNIESLLKQYAGINQSKIIIKELNDILFNTENKDVKTKLQVFIDKYPKYNFIFQKHLQSEYIWTFLKLDIFTDCKTNNNIEGLHSQLDSVTSQHNSFETTDSLYRALINEIERYNESESHSNEKLKESNLNMDIKELFKVACKNSLITICVKFNGRVRINKEITKSDYDMIRGIIQTE